MAKKHHPAVDLPVYWAVRGLFFCLAWLPERIVYPMLDVIGRTFFVFARRRRAIALSNLRLAFGRKPTDRDLLAVASRACGAAFMVAGDLAKAGRYVATGRLRGAVDLGAWEERDAELAALGGGRPPILCTPHLGSWEVAGLVVGTEFAGIHIIARPLGNPYLHAYVERTRSRTGQHIHPRRGGIRHLLAGLRAGQAVGTLPDQNQRLRGLFVPVFGKLASCDRSQARLAQLTGAPIVVGAAIRTGRRFRFRLEISDAFLVAPGGEGGGDPVLEATRRLQRAVEKLILAAPDQYFWVHNRYRTRPPDEQRARKKRSA